MEKIVVAVVALGSAAIFAIGMWLIILTDQEAVRRRQKKQKGRRK